MVILKKWSVGFAPGGDAYTPPECRERCLQGVVYGHPMLPDGEKIRTSAIVSAKGRVVCTRHTTYRLHGRPDNEYVKYLRGQGLPRLDTKNPIKVHSAPAGGKGT